MTERFSEGQLVSFSEKRGTLRYKLAPYNEKARDRDATFAEGSIDFSNAEGAIVNVEHDQFRPIGKLSQLESKPDGLYATVTLADTTLGRDTFTEAKEGLRTGISMELSEMTPSSGLITKATLSGAGICVNPALGSARLISAFSEDSEPEEEIEETEDTSTPEEPEEEETAEADAEAETEKEDDMSENAAVPTALAAANSGANLSLTPATIAKAYATKDERLAFALEDAGLVGQDAAQFALSGITGSAHTSNIEQAQWLGQLWSGKTYNRKYVNLVSTGSLTSWKVEGWKFITKPVVGDYAGDLADIPSNTVTTEHYSEEAERLAGGWKLDRKYRDFGNTEFISSFFAAATEDYARKSDRKVLDFIVANAQPVTGTVVADGVAPATAKIIKGALSMVEFADPTFALVGLKAYEEIFNSKEDDKLAFLQQSFSLNGGETLMPVIPCSEIGANDVYVGAKEAITFFELPGTPIQVSALDVSKGGEDEALFGYYALILNDARGLKKVS
ncbi:hypothetical protein [Paenarthrobacter sp. NPDC057981]|uniref:phage major capsid protein n=1 Tax=Paenarthrobacter sp. NPDC057981 TaxID=3346297 RepID=UPI0036DB2474